MVSAIPSRSILLESVWNPFPDDKSYRVIKLPNAIEALLVHDAETEKASGATDVNVESSKGLNDTIEHIATLCPYNSDPYPESTVVNSQTYPWSWQCRHSYLRNPKTGSGHDPFYPSGCVQTLIKEKSLARELDALDKYRELELGKYRGPNEYQSQRRRGRGKRRNDAYWKDHNSTDDGTDPFDGRECLFSDERGRVRVPALANLDTGLKVPGGLIMSSRYARELGRDQDISQEFDDPCLRSISGHITPVTGVLRNVVFRLRGTSVTFKRDFYICDAIDDLVDIMLGANFIKDHFKLLFERVRECLGTFATWFSTKKETKEEKAERERCERDQQIKAHMREILRLQKEQQKSGTAQGQGREGPATTQA